MITGWDEAKYRLSNVVHFNLKTASFVYNFRKINHFIDMKYLFRTEEKLCFEEE